MELLHHTQPCTRGAARSRPINPKPAGTAPRMGVGPHPSAWHKMKMNFRQVQSPQRLLTPLRWRGINIAGHIIICTGTSFHGPLGKEQRKTLCLGTRGLKQERKCGSRRSWNAGPATDGEGNSHGTAAPNWNSQTPQRYIRTTALIMHWGRWDLPSLHRRVLWRGAQKGN